MRDAEREFLEAVHAAKRYTETVKADLVSHRLQVAYGTFLDRLVEASRAAQPPVEVTAQAAAWRRGITAYRAWLATPGQVPIIANDA